MNAFNKNSNVTGESTKQAYFEMGKNLYDIIYYLGCGFMLADHLCIYAKVLYGMSSQKINSLIQSLHEKGLLLKKQAAMTDTKIFVLPKYVTAKYRNKTSRDVSSIRITESKLWKNLYLNEYIIKKILKPMIEQNAELSIHKIFELLDRNFISFYSTQNREDVYNLYSRFAEMFGCMGSEAFWQDFYTLTADLYTYEKNFLKIRSSIDLDECMRQKKLREFEICTFKTEADRNKNFYNLYQMVMNGFFFNGKVINNAFEIGLFETKTLNFDKIYMHSAYIFLMLKRYLGCVPKVILKIYGSDKENYLKIEREAENRIYKISRQEFSENTKKIELYKSLGIEEDCFDNIEIKYINYNLKEKYKL